MYKTNFAEDCIHLKACRRICKYHKISNRGCKSDYCTAYESVKNFIKIDDASEITYYLLEDLESGHSKEDLQCAAKIRMQDACVKESR